MDHSALHNHLTTPRHYDVTQDKLLLPHTQELHMVMQCQCSMLYTQLTTHPSVSMRHLWTQYTAALVLSQNPWLPYKLVAQLDRREEYFHQYIQQLYWILCSCLTWVAFPLSSNDRHIHLCSCLRHRNSHRKKILRLTAVKSVACKTGPSTVHDSGQDGWKSDWSIDQSNSLAHCYC